MYRDDKFNIRKSLQVIVVLALCVFAFIFSMLEFVCDGELGFSVFLVFLPVLGVWCAGSVAGILTAVFCATFWIATDVFLSKIELGSLVFYLNFAIHLFALVLIVEFSNRFKRKVNAERRLAREDALTGLINGKAFYDCTRVELAKAKRYNRPLTVVSVSCNNFKSINKKFGYEQGDRALCVIASIIQGCIRESDACARFGADEFMLLLPESEYSAAAIIVKRLHKHLEKTMIDNDWLVTFSIGALSCDQFPEIADDIIRSVDALMIEAKKSGENIIKHNNYISE